MQRIDHLPSKRSHKQSLPVRRMHQFGNMCYYRLPIAPGSTRLLYLFWDDDSLGLLPRSRVDHHHLLTILVFHQHLVTWWQFAISKSHPLKEFSNLVRPFRDLQPFQQRCHHPIGQSETSSPPQPEKTRNVSQVKK